MEQVSAGLSLVLHGMFALTFDDGLGRKGNFGLLLFLFLFSFVSLFAFSFICSVTLMISLFFYRFPWGASFDFDSHLREYFLLFFFFLFGQRETGNG